MASMLEMLSPTAASINCRTTLRWSSQTSPPRQARTGAAARESLSPVYFAASGDLFVDGRNPLGRHCRLYPTAGFRVARSRLSHHSSAHLLPRRQPQRGGDNGDRATGASIRGTARPEPDDFNELRWHLRDRTAVQPGGEYRCRRGRGTVRDQRFAKLVAIHSACASDLQ